MTLPHRFPELISREMLVLFRAPKISVFEILSLCFPCEDVKDLRTGQLRPETPSECGKRTLIKEAGLGSPNNYLVSGLAEFLGGIALSKGATTLSGLGGTRQLSGELLGPTFLISPKGSE